MSPSVPYRSLAAEKKSGEKPLSQSFTKTTVVTFPAMSLEVERSLDPYSPD